MKRPCIYILTNKRYGTLYVGVTSNLMQRISHHRQGIIDGFTKRYSLHRLVYIEIHSSMESAIQREKSLKRWHRNWKINLIERDNPHWIDLFFHLQP